MSQKGKEILEIVITAIVSILSTLLGTNLLG